MKDDHHHGTDDHTTDGDHSETKGFQLVVVCYTHTHGYGCVPKCARVLGVARPDKGLCGYRELNSRSQIF